MGISFILRDYPSFLAEGALAARSRHDSVLSEMIAAARAGYTRNGEQGLLESLYAKQKKLHETGKIAGTVLAKTCLVMGKRNEALGLLEEDIAHHNVAVIAILSEPDLRALKDELRYAALLLKLNFPATPHASTPGSLPMPDPSTMRVSSGSR